MQINNVTINVKLRSNFAVGYSEAFKVNRMVQIL